MSDFRTHVYSDRSVETLMERIRWYLPKCYGMIGKFLDSSGRFVFVHNDDPTKVVKVDDSYLIYCELDDVDNWIIDDAFANYPEWDVWNSCSSELRDWLAPCHWIDDTGTCLIMDRAIPLENDDEISSFGINPYDFWPDAMIDLGAGNLGMIGDKFVIIDYERVIPWFKDWRCNGEPVPTDWQTEWYVDYRRGVHCGFKYANNLYY